MKGEEGIIKDEDDPNDEVSGQLDSLLGRRKVQFEYRMNENGTYTCLNKDGTQ